MNRHSNNTNALLVEIMAAVLFFALCSTILLQVFAGAHNNSRNAALTTGAMTEARSCVELLNGADDPAAVLAAYTLREDGSYVLERDGYRIVVSPASEALSSGRLLTTGVQAVSDRGEVLFTLRSSRYIPGEVE